MPAELRGRALRVRRLEMLPVECIVRGYITGSGWKDYQATGKVSGIELPEGLQESEQLPEPIYTPSTKAEEGHDEAIDFAETVRLVGGEELAAQLRDVSIAVYSAVAAHARERGVILADTKFEFGLDAAGVLTLGDEVCTPDSSRFWPADSYEVGRGQPSFDKQYVRDWATSTGWDKIAAGAADPGRRRRADARAVRDGLRAARGRAVRRVAGPRRVTRVRVLIRPKAGILDPQGQAVERALPALGFEGVANVHVGRLVELDVPDAVAGAGDVREAARQPADRGLRDPREVRGRAVPGVVRRGRRAARGPPRRRGRAAVARRRRPARRRRRDRPRRVLLRRLPARAARSRGSRR